MELKVQGVEPIDESTEDAVVVHVRRVEAGGLGAAVLELVGQDEQTIHEPDEVAVAVRVAAFEAEPGAAARCMDSDWARGPPATPVNMRFSMPDRSNVWPSTSYLRPSSGVVWCGFNRRAVVRMMRGLATRK